MSKNRTPTQAQFLKDVESHEIRVLRDDGIYRHIRFKAPGTMCEHFDLLTWPGYLCYTGDMGTYVFARLADMFEFFRTKPQAEGGLYINLSYWSEKLIAVDGQREGGAAKEFSEDKFRAAINEYRLDWVRDAKRDGTLDKEQRRELWDAVEDEVLSVLDDYGDVQRAQQAAYDFCFKPFGRSSAHKQWQFEDIFEHNFTDYTHRFVWCCYALSWGIAQYDKHKAKELVTA